MEVKAKKVFNENVVNVVIDVDMGTTMSELVELYTEDIVYKSAIAAIKISAQSNMRRLIAVGKTAEEVVTEMESWKPGVTERRTIDPVASLLSKWGSMSEEEKADVLAKLDV